jgi:antitoxin VapB
MAILIKDPAADAAIRALAQRTGETLTEAVRKAAEERLARIAPRKGRVDFEKLEKVLARLDSLPRINEHLTDDEIVGYNEEGHFG